MDSTLLIHEIDDAIDRGDDETASTLTRYLAHELGLEAVPERLLHYLVPTDEDILIELGDG